MRKRKMQEVFAMAVCPDREGVRDVVTVRVSPKEKPRKILDKLSRKTPLRDKNVTYVVVRPRGKLRRDYEHVQVFMVSRRVWGSERPLLATIVEM